MMADSPRRAVKRKEQTLAPVFGATGILAFIGLGLAWAAYVRRYVLHDLPMTAALSGELRNFMSNAGRVAYYSAGPARRAATVARQAPPLLFLHSINAAPSSYEMKPLYEHYARDRKVYSLDLPGFGFSERSDRVYTPQLYRDVINEFIAKELKGGPVDAVALSLTSEFLALAAAQQPAQFRALTFISPTGLSGRDMQAPAGDMLLRFVLHPRWSRLIFDTLTSRPSIGFFTRQARAENQERGFAHYAYVTSHQPNAQFAPFYFVAGKLFTPGVMAAYQALAQQVLIVYGRSRTARFDGLDDLRARPNWTIAEFNHCADLVQFDDPAGLIAQMDQLFARV